TPCRGAATGVAMFPAPIFTFLPVNDAENAHVIPAVMIYDPKRLSLKVFVSIRSFRCFGFSNAGRTA
ncbi:MAG: hypothetical protein OXC93_03995, partial [Rhodospirillaceae bacterium]|nr:hypothetical protein [Rhodospirillaceae bacterium]